jgi:flagellar basal body-associated protein FliL
MTDKKTMEKIQQSMNRSLSGMDTDDMLTERVLRRAEKNQEDEKTMKKKTSGSLILAIILIILAATVAVAVTNWDSLKHYFETVRMMETTGELARWSDEDKVKLLQAMVDAGIVDTQDAHVQTAMDVKLPLAQRGAAADAVITARYGEEYFDSYTVEQLEFPEKERSPEEQASFGQWSKAYWAQWSSQEKQPLTESRIYHATINNLTEIGEFPRSLLRDIQVSSEWNEEEQIYTITASIDKSIYLASKQGTDSSLFDPQSVGYERDGSLCFQFWLDRYGTFLGIKNPNSPEARAKLSLEEAKPIAEKALKVRLNVEADTLNSLPLRTTYAEGSEYILAEGRFRAVCTFIWGQEGDARYMVDIDAQTGRVIKAFDWHESNAMLEKERAWVAEIQGLLRNVGISDSLINQQDQYIWSWSLEERATWSRVARPIVHRYLSEHPDFVQYLENLLAHRYAQSSHWPNLISLTQYAYGTPDASAISQDKAFDIARGVALERGAQQRYVDDNEHHVFYYDVTDPARPLWKVLVNVLFGDGDVEHPYSPTAPHGYFVVMDARTGEVLRVVERTVNTDIREIV